MKNKISSLLLAFLLLAISTNIQCSQPGSSITKEKFGTVDGKQIDLYTLTNKNGLEAKIINYGAIVVSLMVPDKNGKMADIVTGYDSLSGYVNDRSFFGAIVGRYGNRINKGKFSLNGVDYQLTAPAAPVP